MESKNRIGFFDMEGTLFKKSPIQVYGNVAPSVWAMIPEILGESAVATMREGVDKWNDKVFAGYVEWVEFSLANYKRHGLSKKQFDEVIGAIDYHPGVMEVFQQIRPKFRTALVSGGFKAQADRAQRDLKLDHAFTACEILWDENDKIEHWNSLPCDYEGKRDFMELIIKEHKADPAECFFVGDGVNDTVLAQAVGTSIAFNAHPALQEVSTHVINQEPGKEDFRAVLEFIPH